MYLFAKIQLFEVQPCPDPESYVRGGPTLTLTFFYLREGGSKYHYRRADNGPTLNAGLVAL